MCCGEILGKRTLFDSYHKEPACHQPAILDISEHRVRWVGKNGEKRRPSPLQPSHHPLLVNHAPCCVFYEDNWGRVRVRDI